MTSCFARGRCGPLLRSESSARNLIRFQFMGPINVNPKMKSIRLIAMVAALVVCLPLISFGKRAAPKAVEPALTQSLRIVAPLDDGRVARIQVFDRADGRLLWSLMVFENKMQPGLEEDVQWRFIKSLKVTGDSLEVVAEDGASYRVNLTTRQVEPLSPNQKG